MTDLMLEKEYGPSHTRTVIILAIGAIFFAIGYALFDPEKSITAQLAATGSMAMGALVAITRLIGTFTGRPKIVLTPEGIENRGILRTKTHAWRDVGVFALRTQSIRYNTTRYLCAFSDLNHDALHQGASPSHTTVGTYNADISIIISELAAGRKDETAEEMAAEFNRWRQKYGAPEDNAYHMSAEEKAAIGKKKKRKEMLSIALIVVIVVGLIAAKIYAKM